MLGALAVAYCCLSVLSCVSSIVSLVCHHAYAETHRCRMSPWILVWTALLLSLMYYVYIISWHMPTRPQPSGGLSYQKLTASNSQNDSRHSTACSWSQTAGLTPCLIRSGRSQKMVAKIHLAVVACGKRAVEAVILLKSAVVFTTYSFLVIHVFTEKQQHLYFDREISGWPPAILERAEFRLYDVTYPVVNSLQLWRKKFAPCASQRLFFPTLLKDVDALIYLDADTLLLTAADKLWDVFSSFNSSQQMALVAEHEDPKVGWYNVKSKIPFVPPLGVNSGVMLMNLTRMRQANWLSTIIQYEKQYRYKLLLFDQDLINIYCHFHPEYLYLMDCSANYRTDHCYSILKHPNSTCKQAEQKGVQVMHGSRRGFSSDNIFKTVHAAFRKYQVGEDLQSGLYKPLRESLLKVKGGRNDCHLVSHIFLKQV